MSGLLRNSYCCICSRRCDKIGRKQLRIVSEENKINISSLHPTRLILLGQFFCKKHYLDNKVTIAINGREDNNFPSNNVDGLIQEEIWWLSNQSANLSAIEININTYYGIY